MWSAKLSTIVNLGRGRSSTKAPARFVDFDLLTLLLGNGIGRLGQHDPEEAVLEVRGDLIGVDLVGERYGALEGAVRAFRAMDHMALHVLFLFVLGPLLTFAGQLIADQ